MEGGDKVIPFVKASSRPLNTLKPAGVEEAKRAAQMILSCYPDYGKVPPEYIVNLIDVLATYPSHILPQLCDLRQGIPAQCRYIPAVADIVGLADAILDSEAAAQEAQQLENQRQVQAEKTAEQTALNESRLAKARKKYRTAYLADDGGLRYLPELEGKVISDEEIQKAQHYSRKT